jgi:hypothetical protein
MLPTGSAGELYVSLSTQSAMIAGAGNDPIFAAETTADAPDSREFDPDPRRYWTMDAVTAHEAASTLDRRNGDRRGKGIDRRRVETAVAVERRQGERRIKVERRRQIDPTTCERDYTADEVEFMRAMDDYKRRSGRPFPTWSEVLEVVRGLGYVKCPGGEATAPAGSAPPFQG